MGRPSHTGQRGQQALRTQSMRPWRTQLHGASKHCTPSHGPMARSKSLPLRVLLPIHLMQPSELKCKAHAWWLCHAWSLCHAWYLFHAWRASSATAHSPFKQALWSLQGAPTQSCPPAAVAAVAQLPFRWQH